ncbi:MAG: DUF1501 domain-containing protein [Planctomycetota bacterium]|nr:DUF1501 domain-containing protein [Planctomycetota bacterium]
MSPTRIPLMNSPFSRRELLAHTGGGFAGVALASLLADEARASGRTQVDLLQPLAERMPHFAPSAKQVIFLFMYGGPSTFDLFDYKPSLIELHGQPVPASFKERPDKVGGVFNHCKDELMAGPWKWSRHGETGLWFSDLLPHTAKHADELCVVHSMFSESSNHGPATLLMNTGATLGGRPSLGSWITYGLGSASQNLPGYILLYQVGGLGGSANWSNGFLPAAFQGTRFRQEGTPVLNLQPPPEFADVQRSTLDLAQKLNRKHADKRPGVPDLDGRIASYELAYRMQSAALDVGELSLETAATQESYGLNDENKDKALFGRMCLFSRRLIEKGVRCVQIYNAVDKLGWDGHDNNTDYNRRNAAQTDQPVAALLTDLKQRGLLDTTLVIWGGEFGRTPMMQGNEGRNHNPYGFGMWMAGGGVTAGATIGATDDIGLRAVEEPQPVKNLHATILTALGLNPDDLYYEHHGRQERLTGVAASWKTIPGVLE